MALYYLSNLGNDDNAGTISGPFKTSAKLAEVLTRTDNAYYKRGDRFDPLILSGIAASGITEIQIGAYGTGPDPIISGGILPSGWVSIGGNKWEYTNAGFTDVRTFSISGADTPKGKFPETGFGLIASATGSTVVNDDDTLGTAPDLVGGTLVSNKQVWMLNGQVITSQNSTSLTVTTDSRNFIVGYNWFVINHPNCLYKNGDWCYDNSTKKITLYHTTDPNTLDIEVSFFEHACKITNSPNITIKDIEFKHSYLDTVFITSTCDNIKIFNGGIEFSGTNGIRTFTSDFLRVEGTYIRNTNNHGILVRDASTDATITKCKFENIAVKIGEGGYADGQMCGIFISNTEHRATITDNFIDKVGNCGIFYRGNDVFVSRNYVRKAGNVVGDSGGIYTYSGNNPPYTNMRCIRNIVEDCHANLAITNRDVDDACGIYGDDNTVNWLVSQNYVFNCGRGIYLHNVSLSEISYNILYNNEYNLYLSDDNTIAGATNRMTNLDIQFNRFSSLVNQKNIFIRVIDDYAELDPFNFGIINNNFFDDFEAQPFEVLLTFNFQTSYDLAGWRSNYGFDLDSFEAGLNVLELYPALNEEKEPITITLETIHLDWDDVDVYPTFNLDGYGSRMLFDTFYTPPDIFINAIIDPLPDADMPVAGVITRDINGPYLEGQEIEFTATANDNYEFDRWTDFGGTTISTSNVFIFEAGSETETIYAVFKVIIITTVFPVGSGTVEKDPVGAQLVGESFELTATPDTGKEFLRYEVLNNSTLAWNELSTDNPYNGTMEQYLSIRGLFDEVIAETFNITKSVTPEGGGTLVKNPSGPQVSGGAYTLTATANANFEFLRLEVFEDGDWELFSELAEYEGTITENLIIRAVFEGVIQIFAVPNFAERGTVVGGGNYDSGDSVELVAIRNEGFEFIEWNDGEKSNPRTVIALESKTYVAIFRLIGQCPLYLNVKICIC